jgi:hypothetical protein
MNEEVREEAPERITGDLSDFVPETPAVETPNKEPETPQELPQVKSTAPKTEAPTAPPADAQQPMVVNPDGSRRPATQEEIAAAMRAQECGQALNDLLNKYDCDLDVSMVLTTRGILPNVQVIPRTRQDSNIIRPTGGIVTP